MDERVRGRRGGVVTGRRLRAALGIAAVAVALAGCAKDETTASIGAADDIAYFTEKAADVGPNVFTPPFTNDAATASTTTAPSSTTSSRPSNTSLATTSSTAAANAPVCDVALFLKDLQARPDAMAAWAQVLKVPVESIPAYVGTLQPAVLATDFKVTNHGFKDGQAYPRNSILTAGTAVLVDPTFGSRMSIMGPQPTYAAPPQAPLNPSTTAPPKPADAYPVTRCKCGNPLLPPPTASPLPPPGGTYAPGTTTHTTSPGTTLRPAGTGTSSSTTSSTPPHTGTNPATSTTRCTPNQPTCSSTTASSATSVPRSVTSSSATSTPTPDQPN